MMTSKKWKLRKGVNLDGFVHGEEYKLLAHLHEDNGVLSKTFGKNVSLVKGMGGDIKVVTFFEHHFINYKHVDDEDLIKQSLKNISLTTDTQYKKNVDNLGYINPKWPKGWIVPSHYMNTKSGLAMVFKGVDGSDLVIVISPFVHKAFKTRTPQENV